MGLSADAVFTDPIVCALLLLWKGNGVDIGIGINIGIDIGIGDGIDIGIGNCIDIGAFIFVI